MTLSAGVAVRDITPKRPLFLVGYPHVPRTSTGVHDPLMASALCLREGSTTILLIGCDILFVSHESSKTCREAISRATKIPEANILISATHTHSGPVTQEMLAWGDDPLVPPPDPEYMAHFHKGIIEAGIEAHSKLAPAQAAVTGALVKDVGGNRISAEGPSDPEAGLLVVRRSDNKKLLAINMVYCMHPTVMHEDSALVSGDFPAYTKKHLQEMFPGVTVVYHTGPSGDQSPRRYVRGQTFAEAERLGRLLGDVVAGSVRSIKNSDFTDKFPLGAARRFVEPPPRAFLGKEEAEAALAKAREKYERLKREGTDRVATRTAEVGVFGAEEVVCLAAAQAAGKVGAWRKKYALAEIQVFRLGSTFLVGLPGEMFISYSLDIRKRAPAKTFVVELANGELQGYIVTPEATGYEASCSFFKPETGRLFADTALAMMKELPR